MARLFWASWRCRKVLWRTVNLMKTLQPLTHSYPAQQSPFQGCRNVTLFPSPLTQVLPSEAAFSQHGVIRRKISSCQVGANQNSTNKPWHSTTPRVPAALGGEYRLVMNMAGCRGSSGDPPLCSDVQELFLNTTWTTGCLFKIRADKQRLAEPPSCLQGTELCSPNNPAS